MYKMKFCVVLKADWKKKSTKHFLLDFADSSELEHSTGKMSKVTKWPWKSGRFLTEFSLLKKTCPVSRQFAYLAPSAKLIQR